MAAVTKKRHRQRDQRVELDGLGHIALHHQLHHIGGVGAEHQHLAVSHVDHAEQAEGDRQAQSRQQQDRAQGHAAERLAEDFTHHQFAFDLGQAGFSGGVHGGVGFHAWRQQRFKARAGQRVAGAAEQAHGCQAHHRVGVDQLQVGQGQAQGAVHLLIRFGGDLLVEEFKLCRHRAFLQGARCVQAHLGVGGEQLLAGLHVIDQAAQAVVQAHGLGFAVEHELTLLKGVHQLDTRWVGVGGPVLQEFGLLHRVGGKEVFGVAGVCAKGQQQQHGEDEAVEGSGHSKMS